jgi:hypothetical protein
MRRARAGTEAMFVLKVPMAQAMLSAMFEVVQVYYLHHFLFKLALNCFFIFQT